MPISELSYMFKIILLAEVIGSTMGITAWLWFKWLGIDFKKWMNRPKKN